MAAPADHRRLRPSSEWERAWAGESPALHTELDRGGRVVVRCKGGLGRAGLVAARLLVKRGLEPDDAISAVRAARPGAIETTEQEEYVRRRSVRAEGVPKARSTRAAREPSPTRDRALGALLGLAVGDALGTTLEFSRRDSLPEQTEITGGGPFGLKAGVWTDDTSMALALADSLATCGGLDELDLMTRFVRWWREGAYSPVGRCFDIGGVTRAALTRFEQVGEPVAGDRSPRAAGNGSLMRLAPVAIFAGGKSDLADELARRQSATTHAATECLEACAFFARVLVGAIRGEPRDRLLAPQHDAFSGKVGDIAAAAWRGKTRPQIKSSGYVIDTLEAALWCVAGADSFETAVTTAVNLGDDADTVGAVTGQLAGALWGYTAIPERWTARLAWRCDWKPPRICSCGAVSARCNDGRHSRALTVSVERAWRWSRRYAAPASSSRRAPASCAAAPRSGLQASASRTSERTSAGLASAGTPLVVMPISLA